MKNSSRVATSLLITLYAYPAFADSGSYWSKAIFKGNACLSKISYTDGIDIYLSRRSDDYVIIVDGKMAFAVKDGENYAGDLIVFNGLKFNVTGESISNDSVLFHSAEVPLYSLFPKGANYPIIFEFSGIKGGYHVLKGWDAAVSSIEDCYKHSMAGRP